MTIHRRIFKVKTLGKRGSSDPLRPAISDDLPHGLNYVVHEYDEVEDACIVEVWCSDHPLLPQTDRKAMADIAKLRHHPSFITRLTDHAKSPTILARQSLSVFSQSAPNATVDKAKKEITWQGRKGTYIRTYKETPHGKKEQDVYVFDEG